MYAVAAHSRRWGETVRPTPRRRSLWCARSWTPVERSAMRAPNFWRADAGGAAALALSPLSYAYDLAASVRRGLAHPAHASLPVICVTIMILRSKRVHKKPTPRKAVRRANRVGARRVF